MYISIYFIIIFLTPIHFYLFSTKPLEKRASILLNGGHHARELTSISMVVWLMLRFLYSWERGDPDIYSRLVQN